MLLARLREQHPGIEVDASEATTGHLCRELLSRRLDVAIGFCVEPVPGLMRRTLVHEPMYVLMRRGHRLCLESEVVLEAFQNDRFVVPGVGLNTGFNRRLSLMCGFEPRTVPAGFIWDDGEWPSGRGRRRAGDRAGRAQRAESHALGAARAGADDADRPRLARGRRLAGAEDVPRSGYAGAGCRTVNDGISACSSGPIETA